MIRPSLNLHKPIKLNQTKTKAKIRRLIGLLFTARLNLVFYCFLGEKNIGCGYPVVLFLIAFKFDIQTAGHFIQRIEIGFVDPADE